MHNSLIQLLALLFALIAGTANASDPFFLSCDTALSTPPFKRLREFYAHQPDESKPEACFRLNDREFLVTVTDAPRISQGLYYYSADSDAYDFPDSSSRPNIAVLREFEGPNKKHFVILSSSNLHGGNWNTGYELLFLKPRESGRSFILQNLLSASQNPATGMCDSNMKKGTTTAVKAVRVEHEGSANISIIFGIDSQVCPNGKKRNYERRFVWSGDRFSEADGK